MHKGRAARHRRGRKLERMLALGHQVKRRCQVPRYSYLSWVQGVPRTGVERAPGRDLPSACAVSAGEARCLELGFETEQSRIRTTSHSQRSFHHRSWVMRHVSRRALPALHL